VRADRAIHGMPEAVQHSGQGIFAGLPQGATFTRYHSLIVEGLPAPHIVSATSEAGELMALQAEGAPAWGVQFHPESLLSEYGRVLLGNWLQLAGHRKAERRAPAAR
jgi:anthranilate synthase